ncbi:MAG TPA: family 20 glycosylhydrolase [Paraburkholderia sp.]
MRFVTLAAFVGLTVAAVAQTTPSPLHLIPMPREVTFKADVPITGVKIECRGCGAEDQFAADDLRDTLAARGVPTGDGLHIFLERLGQHPDAGFTEEMRPEGYTIAYAEGKLTLTGATASGVFYAAQTAKQMIERELSGSFVLHAADIRDWPAMKYRGLDDDMSRGPLDTLEFQKKIVRTIAAYKDNLYSPYFEHTQQYASNPLPAPPGGSISAADARELVAYATKYHVMVVPEQEAFGHLHHALLYEEYQPLAETPHGQVLAPGQPGSIEMIKQMFTELAALYPSPFLHVGADETFELGQGQTKAAVDAQGLGPVYLNFLEQIDTALRPLNRKLLFWGDIAEKSPELLKGMPESFKHDMIAISWHYSPSSDGYTKYLNYFKSAGFEFWVSPGINNWSRVYPNYNMGLENIQEFTRDGQNMGADGQLNTIWYDDGEALASNNWYGILFGCASAWQQGESSIPQFQANYGPVFHGDLTGKLNMAQEEIMAAHDVLKYDAQVGDGSDGIFWVDPWSKEGQEDAEKIRPYTHELRMHAEHAMELIAQARAAYPAPATEPVVYSPTNELPSNPTSLRETNAIDALELGARRLDFIGLKFQLSDEMAADYALAQTDALSTDRHTRGQVNREFGEIDNRVDGRLRDIRDEYALLRGLYSQLWLRTNRPYSLRPVLEHYDSTVGLWQARMDSFHDAQLQWGESRMLPTPAELGIPAPPPPAPVTAPSTVPSSVPPAATTPASSQSR